MIPGGILADRSSRFDLIILLGFGISSVIILIAGSGWLPFFLVIMLICVAGGMRGVNASRDVAVRQIAGRIPVGTVFAFVSTGFLVGQALMGLFMVFFSKTIHPTIFSMHPQYSLFSG